MPYALWLPDVLTDAGLIVRPYPGWETRGKSDFAPRGHMLHHTVTKPSTPDLTIDKFLAVTGSSSTPPPLANISTNRDGSVSIIAAGTANHGGAGNWNGISGNKNWIGDEMKNLGSGVQTSVWYEPWVPGQVEAAQRAAAACLNHIGADETWLMGHKEYATPPGRKTDPHTLNMNTIRATVKTIMEDDMPLSDEDIAKVALAVANVKVTRAGQQVSWLQETADIKTLLLAQSLDANHLTDDELDAAVDRLVAALPDATVDRLRDRLL